MHLSQFRAFDQESEVFLFRRQDCKLVIEHVDRNRKSQFVGYVADFAMLFPACYIASGINIALKGDMIFFERADGVQRVTAFYPTGGVVISEESSRPFKIIRQELDFYRFLNLPAPRLHPEERYRKRLQLRNPRKLWSRECAKCGKPIETSYVPERPEIVYCESCYLREVY